LVLSLNDAPDGGADLRARLRQPDPDLCAALASIPPNAWPPDASGLDVHPAIQDTRGPLVDAGLTHPTFNIATLRDITASEAFARYAPPLWLLPSLHAAL